MTNKKSITKPSIFDLDIDIKSISAFDHYNDISIIYLKNGLSTFFQQKMVHSFMKTFGLNHGQTLTLKLIKWQMKKDFLH